MSTPLQLPLRTRERPDQPELLAPAGDWDCLRAAVAHGADAVYFGLPHFNARFRATNFSLEELPKVFDFLHQHGVRGYVTLNVLIFSDELQQAAELVAAAAAAGADALIVQDLGLVHLVKNLVPDLPLHASTQMTLTERRGVEFARKLGIERAILARELSVAEVGLIAKQVSLPVEVFVHGALCVAYSGQCLTSEALGGRSANRGQCAQACRLPYDLIVDGVGRDVGDKAYLLSPQDLAAHDLVPELLAAGVCSLKIEGRLKAAPYVAATTQTYRAALDAALAQQPFKLGPSESRDLQQAFSRGFGPGFLGGVNHQRLVPGRFPKARGVLVGMVIGHTGKGLLVALDPQHESGQWLKPGDGIVCDEGHPQEKEPGGNLTEVHHTGRTTPAREPILELVWQRDAFDHRQVEPGSLIWRTNDPTLKRRFEQQAAQLDQTGRVPLNVHISGQPGTALQVVCKAAGLQVEVSWPGPLALAQKHPLTEESARAQFGRLGETPFQLATMTLSAKQPIMVPKSVLNDLRRQAVEQLSALREQPLHTRQVDNAALPRLRSAAAARPKAAKLARPQWYVLARTLEQVATVLQWRSADGLAVPDLIWCDFEDTTRYREAVDMCRAAKRKVGLAGLRILKPDEEPRLKHIGKCQPDAVLARNFATIAYFQEEHPGLPIIGDFSLNVANELTAELLLQIGLERLVPSYDLNWEQLQSLVGHSDAGRFETVVHQHMPMFHMEHCVFAALLSTGKDYRDCGRPCDHHQIELRDRVGAAFPVIPDTGCRNTVFNAVAQSAAEYLPRLLALGVQHVRVELLRESPDEIGPLLDRYARVLAGLDDGKRTWRQLQVLNQLGVTRGTLQMS